MTQTEKNRKLIQTVALGGLLLTLSILYIIKANPTYFAVGGGFHQLLTGMGIWAPIFFILFQIAQVIYPVIPGGLTCIVGHAIFGPLYGFLFNFTGIFIGSILSFLLARRYGEGFVKAFVSQETYDKYIGYLDNNKTFERFLAAAFILPGLPDDFFCMVAGLSKISLKKFALIALLTKPITLYLYSAVGFHSIQAIFQMFA